MRKDFYFFRHGQTDANLRGVWQGCSSDNLLNAIGKEQAKELAFKVKKLRLTNLYCSPLLRSVQTANIIVQGMGFSYPIGICQDLRECCFGDAEGLTFEETKARYGEELVNRILFPTMRSWDMHFPNGESKHEVFERVIKCLEYIVETSLYAHGNQNRFGIVCHAGVINALQCGLGLKNVSYENCSILHLACGGEMIAPEVENLKQVFEI